jgi:hypothetical protein
LDVFSLPENDSGIYLPPKNLDRELAKLSILAVQHCNRDHSFILDHSFVLSRSVTGVFEPPLGWGDACAHDATRHMPAIFVMDINSDPALVGRRDKPPFCSFHDTA